MPDVAGWQGRFFEDFAVGDVYVHRLGRTVLEVDNVWFSLLTQNTAPIHVDRHYAAGTEFGRPLVNSTFTLALVTGQSVLGRVRERDRQPGLGGGAVAPPGLRGRHDLLRVGGPVGASARARVRRRASSPSAARATTRTASIVITFVRTVMVYRRGHGPASRRPRPAAGPGAGPVI